MGQQQSHCQGSEMSKYIGHLGPIIFIAYFDMQLKLQYKGSMTNFRMYFPKGSTIITTSKFSFTSQLHSLVFVRQSTTSETPPIVRECFPPYGQKYANLS